MAKVDINKRKFVKLFHGSSNVTDFALRLGYTLDYNNSRLSGSIYKEIKRKCQEFEVDYTQLSKPRKYCNRNLPKLVAESNSIKEVVSKLGLNPCGGGTNSAIRDKIDRLGIDTQHFTGQGWNKGKTRFDDARVNNQAESVEIPWQRAFAKNSRTKNGTLLKRLVLSGKREYKCAICENSEWQGIPIRLRLDHIDGDNSNNQESNLRILCPNCDSQTDTFCRGTQHRSKKIEWWEKL